MSFTTNGADASTSNYVSVDGTTWQPFEDTPPTARGLAENGLAYIYAGLLLLWQAWVEWLRGLWG